MREMVLSTDRQIQILQRFSIKPPSHAIDSIWVPLIVPQLQFYQSTGEREAVKKKGNDE